MSNVPIATENVEFVQRLIHFQNGLYAYVLSLLGDPAAADDVVQSTNVVVLSKQHEFETGTNFTAWVLRIAHFQVLAARRDRSRDRLTFDDELLDEMAEQAAGRAERDTERHHALRACLRQLPAKQRALIEERYATEGTPADDGESIHELANKRGESKAAVVSALYRIRRTLLDCINRRLAGEFDA